MIQKEPRFYFYSYPIYRRIRFSFVLASYLSVGRLIPTTLRLRSSPHGRMSSHSRIVRTSDTSRDSTAFLGAIHAFSLPKTPVQLGRVDYNGWNGALAAAVYAGDGKQREERTAYQENILPAKTAPLVVQKVPAMSYGYRQTPDSFVKEGHKQGVATEGQTPSHIAALRAASKPSGTFNASISPNWLTDRSSNDQSISSSSLSKDESPILATSALVKLFESHANITPSTSRVSSPLKTEPVIRSASLNHKAPFDGRKFEPWRTEPVEGLVAKKQLPGPPSTETISPLILSSNKTKPEDFTENYMTRNERPQPESVPRGTAPLPPPPRRARRNGGPMQPDRTGLTFTNYSNENSSPSSYASAIDMIQSPSSSTEPHTVSESVRNHIPQSVHAQRRVASANNPADTTRHSERPDRSSSAAKRQGREGPLLFHSLTPQLTADSLADAMVASSLASSRAASPGKQVLSPLPRRHSKQTTVFRRSLSHDPSKSRTPSPVKGGMRQTMRAPSKADNDDMDYNWKRNGHILKKHPNKHNEGDRKRWQDEIAEQERKRYEGVWAANKGLWMPPGNLELATKVVNLVVRDIWRRSKLPDHVLGEVWDLVDREGLGRLGKEEFVVGMWLIDQRLKGRKLPVEVSESVWYSARRLTGVKYK